LGRSGEWSPQCLRAKGNFKASHTVRAIEWRQRCPNIGARTPPSSTMPWPAGAQCHNVPPVRQQTTKRRDKSVRPLQGPTYDQPSEVASSLRPRWDSRTIVACLVLVAITLVVFAPTRHFGFVDYDDLDYVAANPHIAQGLTWDAVRWALTSGYFANWHPLTWLSHMVDVQLFGLNAGAHHTVNVLFHVANTLLLFGILQRMTGAVGRSALVAALFAVHPMHVESVAWVAERKDVLSTCCWLLTMWAYVAYAHRPDWRRYALVVLGLTLGLMAKPMVVTLPFVLLLLDLWPLRRATLGHSPRPVSLRLLYEKVPLVALALVASVVTVVVQRQGGAVVRLDLIPLSTRFANALVAYVHYVEKLLWPMNLAAMYPMPRTLPDPETLAGSVVLLLMITGVAIRYVRRAPYLLVGWLWFLGTLVPVIGIVQVGVQSMADRYSYIPSVGLFVMVTWAVADIVSHWPRLRVTVQVMAVAIVVACTMGAMRQVRYWSSSKALWQHAVEATPDNYFAQASLGYVLWKEGHADDAIPHFQESLRIRPDFAEAHNNLGVALAGRGALRDAIAQFSEAIRINPEFKAARDNLAATTAKLNTLDTSLTRYADAVRAKPNDLAARNELGASLAAQGRIDEAIEQFKAAIAIDPNQPDVHFNLGAMLDQKGRSADAAEQFRIALRLNPVHSAARKALEDIARRGQPSR